MGKKIQLVGEKLFNVIIIKLSWWQRYAVNDHHRDANTPFVMIVRWRLFGRTKQVIMNHRQIITLIDSVEVAPSE